MSERKTPIRSPDDEVVVPVMIEMHMTSSSLSTGTTTAGRLCGVFQHKVMHDGGRF